MQILFVSDTHLGFDTPKRPRVQRRRRGDDFVASYRRALAPALAGRVDAVIHGGDVFDHPKVSAATVEDAFAPLRTIAASGVPVFVLAGNHERSQIPYPLLAMQENLHLLIEPRTVVVDVGGARLAVGGFAYARQVRAKFQSLLAQTELQSTSADVRLLCVHHCVEGAAVSTPSGGDFVFRGARDVIRGDDIPSDIAALLSGHIHRHQLLHRRLDGARLPVPVVYPGSTERTSMVERSETKGYLTLELSPGADGGRLRRHRFHPLPARPMVLGDLRRSRDVPTDIDATIARAPRDAVVQLRLTAADAQRHERLLAAARLRAVTPTTMNVIVTVERPQRAPRRFGAARR